MTLFGIWPIGEKLAKILVFALSLGALAITLVSAIWWDSIAFVALLPEAALVVAAHIAWGLKTKTKTTK